MTTINGHTLGERVDTMLGELRAGHNMRSIVEHHLGVCYTEIETLRTACWEYTTILAAICESNKPIGINTTASGNGSETG